MGTGVSVRELTENSKLGAGVSATSVAQVTCPDICPFRGSGCYAESGFIGMHTRRLNGTDLTSDQVIANEAAGIRKLRGKHLPLRLHVVGDCNSDAQAAMLADACRTRLGPVWTYTHAWRTIARESWGAISVLASCESVDLVRALTSIDFDLRDNPGKGGFDSINNDFDITPNKWWSLYFDSKYGVSSK